MSNSSVCAASLFWLVVSRQKQLTSSRQTVSLTWAEHTPQSTSRRHSHRLAMVSLVDSGTIMALAAPAAAAVMSSAVVSSSTTNERVIGIKIAFLGFPLDLMNYSTRRAELGCYTLTQR